jgi:hypothetical protein
MNMPEFKTKEEYENWKSRKLAESSKKTTDKGEVSSTPQTSAWGAKLSRNWKIVFYVIGALILLQIIGIFFKEIIHILAVLLPLLLIAYVVLWLYALIDILKHEFTGSNKVVWLLMVIFIPILGQILYFIIGQKQKINKK